jgi:uncharacterized protein
VIFTSKKDVFLETLSAIAENIKAAAHYFVDYKIQDTGDIVVFAETMKEYEIKGDAYVQELIIALNKAFITPIDREDILALAMAMDDVLDHMKHCASRFELYNITKVDDAMRQFADKALTSSLELAEAVTLLNKKKLMEMRPHIIKINDVESEGDELLRRTIRTLFMKEKNPIKIIQHKEIYEKMEDILNSCEDAGDVLESIIMKNS